MLAGALVDRVQYKNRAFLIGDLSRAVLLVLLAVLVAAHLVSVPLLIVFALLLIVMMIVRPEGLFGVHEVWDFWTRRRPKPVRKEA